MAPSITRWSQERVTRMRRPTARCPFTTTGFSTMAPTARIAPSGGLMMAENSSTGNMPRFDTEKVAPDSSCPRSFRARVRSTRSRASVAIWKMDFWSQSRRTGVISPSSRATAIPTWTAR